MKAWISLCDPAGLVVVVLHSSKGLPGGELGKQGGPSPHRGQKNSAKDKLEATRKPKASGGAGPAAKAKGKPKGKAKGKAKARAAASA